MNILCVLGRYAYGEPSRGEGYEYTNFIPALQRLGHHVTVFDSLDRRSHEDFAALNRALLRRVEEIRPDVVFCVLMQYEVWIETLRIIRKSGVCVINWATDDSWKYPMSSRLIAKEFDVCVTTYPSLLSRYRRDGIGNVVLSQWAANADTLLPPLPAAECRYTVSFVGAAYGNRRALVDALRKAGISVTCFGHGWPSGPVDTNAIREIVRSSLISLNFSEGSQQGLPEVGSRQIKARIFEVPGYGGCLLTEETPGLERYFKSGEEVLTFSSVRDLPETVRSILAEPSRRDAIAWRGFQRVKREHTYEHRFSDILAHVKCSLPQTPIDWAGFEVAAAQHRMSLGLKVLRYILTASGTVFWGRRRGPRAARRLVFELSWRLAADRTYCAAGWPGRMFYHES
jgi:spore maturation protein CgeB